MKRLSVLLLLLALLAVAAPPVAAESTPVAGPSAVLAEGQPSDLPSEALTPESVASTSSSEPPGTALLLAVPHRGQFDGSPYAAANCGPASLAMVLAAYGVELPTTRLRDQANALQGTSGFSDGVSLETLRAIAEDSGLEVAAAGPRWSVEEVRRQVERGWPVLTLVHFSVLPGNESSGSSSDHYVVVVGLTPEGFLARDPALDDGYRTLSPEQLARAWDEAATPGQAIALGPGPDHLPLPIAHLLSTELTGLGTASDLPPSDPADVSPEPTPTATPTPTLTPRPVAPTPTRTPVPDRWTRRAATPTVIGMASPRTYLAATPSAVPSVDALVYAAQEGEPANHQTALVVLGGAALVGALALLRRPPERPNQRWR